MWSCRKGRRRLSSFARTVMALLSQLLKNQDAQRVPTPLTGHLILTPAQNHPLAITMQTSPTIQLKHLGFLLFFQITWLILYWNMCLWAHPFKWKCRHGPPNPQLRLIPTTWNGSEDGSGRHRPTNITRKSYPPRQIRSGEGEAKMAASAELLARWSAWDFMWQRRGCNWNANSVRLFTHGDSISWAKKSLCRGGSTKSGDLRRRSARINHPTAKISGNSFICVFLGKETVVWWATTSTSSSSHVGATRIEWARTTSTATTRRSNSAFWVAILATVRWDFATLGPSFVHRTCSALI